MLRKWHEVIPAVEAVIAARFPHLDPERCHALATRFYDDWSPDAALQQIERSDKAPHKDVEELKKLADHLRKAATCADRLGWHGTRAIGPLTSDLLPREYQPRFRNVGLEAAERLAI